MTARGRPAWIGAWLCVVSAVVSTVFIVALGNAFSLETLIDRAFPVITLAALLTGVMGSLVLSRRPGHSIGRLLVVAGVTASVSLACDAYAVWAAADGNFEPVAMVVSWLASALNANLTVACFALILLLAPDGTLTSPRWRLAVGTTLVGALLMELPPFLEPATFAGTDPQPAWLVTRLVWFVGSLVLLAGLVAALVSVIRRELRTSGRERTQIRWFTTAAGALVGSWIWLPLVRSLLPGAESYALAVLPLYVALLFFPVAMAIAVLGYRLYDIDVIVNRAWLVLGATVFVGVAYVVAVTLVGSSASGLWASALAAASVACAFQPVRVRLVRLADRIAYGDQAVPYLALADLSRRLGRTPDSERLLSSVAEACSHATGAAAARADLLETTGARLASATAPAGVELSEPTALRLDVRYWGETLGALWVQPAPGRALRRRDLLVLTAFSEQAGVAFRNLRLDDELAAQVEELTEIVLRLQESRDRVQRARSDELAALEASLARDTAPRLEAVAAFLERLAIRADDPGWGAIEAELSAAQDELRRLSHGLYPSLLQAEGLGAAVRSLLRRQESGAGLTFADGALPRFDGRVESVGYACVAKALEIRPALRRIALGVRDDQLVLALTGDGSWSSVAASLRDLVEGRGGQLAESAGQLEIALPLTT